MDTEARKQQVLTGLVTRLNAQRALSPLQPAEPTPMGGWVTNKVKKFVKKARKEAQKETKRLKEEVKKSRQQLSMFKDEKDSD